MTKTLKTTETSCCIGQSPTGIRSFCLSKCKKKKINTNRIIGGEFLVGYFIYLNRVAFPRVVWPLIQTQIWRFSGHQNWSFYQISSGVKIFQKSCACAQEGQIFNATFVWATLSPRATTVDKCQTQPESLPVWTSLAGGTHWGTVRCFLAFCQLYVPVLYSSRTFGKLICGLFVGYL